MSRLLILLLTTAAAGFAQTGGFSTLLGTVTDASGAAVPGVRVVAVQDATQASHETGTNESGDYVIPNVRPGVYTVTFEQTSFRTLVRSGVLIEVNRLARVNAALEIGQVVEVVEVFGDATTVDTSSATMKEVVDSRRVVDLPLNGRQSLQLQELLPGAIKIQSGQAASLIAQNTGLSFAVNGARANHSTYSLDGGVNMDMYNNLATAFPNPDALQEFSILQNNYSAADGRNAGAVINMVTKSGTNQIHGTVYEFLRNDKLNTRNFFSTGKPPLRKNQFGATIGGPVRRDKTFYFGAWESSRERTGLTRSNILLPTALERQGDFSQSALPAGRAVADPATVTAANPRGTPFPNNVVPQNMLDVTAKNFAEQFFPLPNLPGNFFTNNVSVPVDNDEFTLKIDHQLSKNNRLSGRYFWSDLERIQNEALFDFNAGFNWVTYNASVTDTHTFSPSVVNSATFTFNRVRFVRGPLETREGKAKNFNDLGCISCFLLAPPDVPTDWAVNIANGFGVRVSTAFQSFMHNWEFRDSLSINRGRHFLTVGGGWLKTRRVGREFFQQSGQFAFDGLRSGAAFGFADFFLGAPRSVFQNSPLQSNPDRTAIHAFVQDDWRATSKLTLNLGVRWVPYLPVVEKRDELLAFRPGQQSTKFPLAPLGVVFPGDAGIPRGIVDKQYDKFEPRFGFAYDPFGDGKTSVRGGYGVFFDTLRLVGINTNSTKQPFSFGVTTFDPFSFTDPYRGRESTVALLQSFGAVPQTQEGRDAKEFFQPSPSNSIDPTFAPGYMQQWNLSVQREAFDGIVVTAAYVGSKGTKFFVGEQLNPGIFIPGQSTPGNIDSRRMFPGFQSIQNTQSSINSTYHALQLSWNKRFARGYTILGSYVFSKSIDGASNDGNSGTGNGATNPFNQAADKGPSDFDVQHRYVTSFLWELPLWRDASGVKRTILAGWQLNGFLTLQTGTPFSISAGQDRSLVGRGADRADLTGEPRTFNSGSNADRVANFIDKSAFALPAPGTFGTSSRNLLNGPGLANLDFSVFKDFHVAEGKRVQFRWEVFNAANRANFFNPNNNFSAGAFGRLTSARDSRIMQFGLKLIF